jgi:hypothetical protein
VVALGVSGGILGGRVLRTRGRQRGSERRGGKKA